MPKLDLYNALQIKAAGGEVLQLKGPGFSWTKPGGPTWTPVVPVDGGPNVGATSFRGIVTQNGDGSYRVTSAPGNTNGRALINMPELAAGVQVVLETSIRYDDATRIICRQVENNDSVGGTTIFDVTRPSVGAVITRSDTYSVITSRRNLHYIGVMASGAFFTINPQTRYRVL